MNDDSPGFVVGHAAFYPVVMLGRPLIVRKPKGQRKARTKAKGRKPRK